MTTNVFNCFWNIQGIRAFFRDPNTCTLKEDVIEQLAWEHSHLIAQLGEDIFSGIFWRHGASSCSPPVWGIASWTCTLQMDVSVWAGHELFEGKSKKPRQSWRVYNCWKFDGRNISLNIILLYTKVRIRKRASRRYDDAGVSPTYAVDGVPDIFSQIGRMVGSCKSFGGRVIYSAHTYILLNCEDPLVRYFER